MGLHRHRRLIAVALAATLAACGAPPEPAPAPAAPVPPPASPQPPADEPDEPDVADADVLVEVLVAREGRDPVGARVLVDGRVQEVRGVGPTLAWRTTRRLDAQQRRALDALLAEPGLAQVPRVFPAGPGAPPTASPAEWRLRGPDGLRPFRFEAYGVVRAEPFDSLERLMRAAPSVDDVVTRWTLATGATPLTFELPCDPATVPSLRPLVNALHDPTLPVDADTTTPAAERLAVTWTRGLQVERTAWLADGRVLRTSATGDVRAARLDPRAEAAMATRLDVLRDPATRPACGPTIVPEPTPAEP